MTQVNLLEYSSLFLFVAKPNDIEHERQMLESIYKENLKVFRVTHETRSGAKVTRVEWECL